MSGVISTTTHFDSLSGSGVKRHFLFKWEYVSAMVFGYLIGNIKNRHLLYEKLAWVSYVFDQFILYIY